MDTNPVLVPLLVGQLLLAGWLMWRRPYNPVAIVGMLTFLFSYLPAVLLLSGSGFESYSWRSFTLLDVASAADAAIFIGLINFCLLLGAVAAEQSYTQKAFIATPTERMLPQGNHLFGSEKLGLVSAAYFLLWLATAFVLYQQSGQTLTEFLVPIKKTGIATEQSGYLRSLYLAIPSVLVVLSYWKHGKLRFSGWMWTVLALLATFSTHQRRELVTTALLIISLGMFLGPLRGSLGVKTAERGHDPKNHTRRMRLTISVALLAGLMLVPMLWYARVYFTSWDRGSDVNAFEIRSFTDILLGSPTAGFPTLVYIQDFVADFGTNPLYLLVYPLTIFIPRALWDSKPKDLDSILQSHYWLMENPSAFWYGEMYYGLGYLAPVATLLLGFGFYRYCMKCQAVPHVWYRTLGALFFMQSVTLFKNGLTLFIIRLLVLVVLLGIAWIACRPRLAEAEPDVAVKQRGIPV